MVKRYEPLVDGNEDDVCGYLSEEAHGQAVMYTDYAALEAERDEWKRRCEATLAMLAPESKALYRAALAIAEGRDNG